MATITRPADSLTVTVTCERCRDQYEITERQHRRKLHAGTAHICQLCRGTTVKPPAAAHYNYWLQRFSIEEIQELGRAIWG